LACGAAIIATAVRTISKHLPSFINVTPPQIVPRAALQHARADPPQASRVTCW
jgi:hypothetical protein